MKKGIFLYTFSLLIVIIGIVAYFIFFAKESGKIQIIQDSQKAEDTLEQEMVIEIPDDEVIENEVAKESSTEKIIEEFKQEVKKPDESIIRIEEFVKKDDDAEKKSASLNIVNKMVSSGFQNYAGERKIDTIILHSSFNSLGGNQYDVDAIIDIYKSYGVSAHYIIGRDGTIYRLVDENDISYHAGVSKVPDGRTNANNFSIGIEIVGNYDDGYTQNQYDAVNELIEDIKSRYDIKYVLGHDDIAPDRKTDPWNFDWTKI